MSEAVACERFAIWPPAAFNPRSWILLVPTGTRKITIVPLCNTTATRPCAVYPTASILVMATVAHKTLAVRPRTASPRGLVGTLLLALEHVVERHTSRRNATLDTTQDEFDVHGHPDHDAFAFNIFRLVVHHDNSSDTASIIESRRSARQDVHHGPAVDSRI